MEFFSSLINYSEYIFWFVLVFTIIVFIHEFGHYYVARLNDIDVEKFSIGFGPVIFSVTDKNSTKWQLSAIPLGGYVKFSGEMYPDNKKDKEAKNKKLFMNKKSLQKASVVLAGPMANFLLSFIIFVCVFFFFGKNYYPPEIGSIDDKSPAFKAGLLVHDKVLSINNKKIIDFSDIDKYVYESETISELKFQIERKKQILTVNITPERRNIESFVGTNRDINFIGIKPVIIPVIGKVIDGSPAYLAGLNKNDKIIKINNKRVYGARQVIEIISSNLEKKVLITILRDNSELINNIVPKSLSQNKEIGQIGIIFKKSRNKLSINKSVLASLQSIYEVSTKTLIAFSEIIFGKRDHCEVGGPILIAKVSNDVANTDMISFIALIALISINLGLINLFPLPLLDGGHFFTYISEFIIGKEINYNVFKVIQTLGVAIIFLLMSFSILNDIYCRVLN